MKSLQEYLIENQQDPKDSMNWEHKFVQEKQRYDEQRFNELQTKKTIDKRSQLEYLKGAVETKQQSKRYMRQE